MDICHPCVSPASEPQSLQTSLSKTTHQPTIHDRSHSTGDKLSSSFQRDKGTWQALPKHSHIASTPNQGCGMHRGRDHDEIVPSDDSTAGKGKAQENTGGGGGCWEGWQRPTVEMNRRFTCSMFLPQHSVWLLGEWWKLKPLLASTWGLDYWSGCINLSLALRPSCHPSPEKRFPRFPALAESALLGNLTEMLTLRSNLPPAASATVRSGVGMEAAWNLTCLPNDSSKALSLRIPRLGEQVWD